MMVLTGTINVMMMTMMVLTGNNQCDDDDYDGVNR